MTRWTTLGLVLAVCLGTPGLAVAGPSLSADAQQDYKKADKELNEVWAGVMKVDWGATKKKIVASELAWIKYRDAEGSVAMDLADADADARRFRRMAELTRERTKALWAILNEVNGD
jgi:uncharacterized protein YecT (DUF1311 family)